MNLGDVFELKYEDPRVCDTYLCAFVERLKPDFVVRLLVLADPLDEFGGESTILCTTTKVAEWTVAKWTT